MEIVWSQLRFFVTEIRRLREDTEGVTALEYGLIAAATCVSIAITVQNVSQPIKTFFQSLFDALKDAWPSVTG